MSIARQTCCDVLHGQHLDQVLAPVELAPLPSAVLVGRALSRVMVVVFAIWCPHGDQCSKGGKQMAKALDEETVRHALLNHLQGSPYHADLGAEEATQLAETAPVDSWEEEWEDVKIEEEGDLTDL